MTHDRITRIFFVSLFLFLLYQAGVMMAPFFGPILAALAAAVVCFPMHRRISRYFKKASATVHALISVLVVLIFLVVPMGLILTATLVEARDVLPRVQATLQNTAGRVRTSVENQTWQRHLPGKVAEILEQRSAYVQRKLAASGEQIAQAMLGSATNVLKDTVGFLSGLLLFLFILFFLFRDGPSMHRYVIARLPLAPAMQARIEARIHETVEGVVRGTILVALIQGLFALIGYLLVGVPAGVLLGCLTAVASLIPAVGTGLVTVPLCIFYLATGAFGKAIFMIIWTALLGVVDNIARPLVVGSASEMPFFWLSLALLGGLAVFGFKGLLLGPLVFALLPIFLDFFQTTLEKPSHD